MKGHRYVPLAAIIVALFLALAVLPSALNLPQSNPSATLEYAPVPPSEADVAPPGGNLSSLGLASSGTLGSIALDGGVAAAAPRAGGVGKSPRTKKCVGSPPRQTEDPMSPPCVAYFDGDNFGVTYPGVTREEIRLLVYADQGSHGTSRGLESDPDSELVDLAEPPAGDEPVWVRAMRAFARYFDDRFQAYGRALHVYVGYTGGDFGPEARRAEAIEFYERAKPFATMAFMVYGNEEEFYGTLADRGVLVFSSLAGRDDSFYRRYPKRVWGYMPSVQQQAKQFSGYICEKVVPHRVSYSGNAQDIGKPRRIGLLRTSHPGFPGMQTFARIVRDLVRACGGDIVAERTFPNSGIAVDTDPGAATAAAGNIAAFQEAGVTTIVVAQGYETEHSKAAARSNYRPEWILAGDGTSDGYRAQSGFQESSVWDHAWSVSNSVLEPAVGNSRCAHALREADPTMPNTDVNYICAVSTFYQDLRQLFTGIQVAGPRLSPDTVDKGFHAIPAIQSEDAQVPACFYEVDDYTCVKDSIPMWWDSSTQNSGGTPGCWRVPERGRRYVAGRWPAGDVAAQKRPNDLCNGFPGVYVVFQ